MNNLNLKTASLLSSVALAASLMSASVYASHIDFQITGIKAGATDVGTGKLYIQLFRGEENYQTGEALMAMAVAPNSDTATVRFSDVGPGEYALRFFHDENNNGELETNLFGLPTEGYGFSNNAKPSFGPVSYQEIKFDVVDGADVVVNTTQVIY